MRIPGARALTIDASGQLGIMQMPDIDTSRCPWKIGDKVRFNSKGFDHFRPSGKEEIKAAGGVMTICKIDIEMAPGVYAVDVEGPLNQYMFTSDLFERAT